MEQTFKEQIEALIHKRQQKLLSRKEAAEMLGITPETLAAWKCLQRYDLPVVMVGRCPRYRLSDIESFIERNTIR